MKGNRLHRVLIIDEDAQARKRLSRMLSGRDICSRTAKDASLGLEICFAWRPDILICELSMRCEDGRAAWREALRQSNATIIVMSAIDDESVKREVLNAGVADYIEKPFGLAEFRNRIEPYFRHVSTQRPAIAKTLQDRIEIGEFTVDRALHQVKIRDRLVHLTPREFDLFMLLASNPNRLIRHGTLSSKLLSDGNVTLEYIHVLIGELRKKIETTPKPRYIVNEFRLGYRFDPNPK